jgi:hypothetical protein
MSKYIVFLWVIIGHIAIASEENPLVEEIRGYLLTLKTISVEEDVGALSLKEASEKADKESTDPHIVKAFWDVQRGIERLMDEEHSFETFKGVVHAVKAFGDEPLSSEFWTLAKHIYTTTEITPKPYDGENHWQSWFKMHNGPSFKGTRDDILGCLLYPVRYTFTHYINKWRLNPFVFYLQAHSASYGNPYARVKTIDYLKTFADNENCTETKILESGLLAITSPFNSSFDIDSDMNKLLWAAFAGGMEMYQCVYKPRETEELVWPQAAEILQQTRIQNGEVLYFLARCFSHMDQKEKAIELRKQSAILGFKESEGKHILLELVNDADIEYATYKEVFGVEI